MIPNGHFLSPNQSLQISDPVGDSAQRYYNYEKWEIPEVAQVQLGLAWGTRAVTNKHR